MQAWWIVGVLQSEGKGHKQKEQEYMEAEIEMCVHALMCLSKNYNRSRLADKAALIDQMRGTRRKQE